MHVVLGNHEGMNLTGDLRYVSDDDYAKFIDPNAPPPASDTPPAAGPPGTAERARAFAPDGRYGAWLVAQPVVIVIDDTAFVHGGLPSFVAREPLPALNTRFHADLVQAIADRNPSPLSDLVGDRGPTWYRGTARCHALLEADRLRGTLRELGVKRVVIGHTPTASRRVQSRFGGAVVMLDTGMLPSAFHGRASALVIEHGVDRVVVAPPEPDSSIESEPGAYAGDWRADDAIAAALSTAPIAKVDAPDPDGSRAVALTTDAGTLDARFVPASKRSARNEIAAYRLDRLLGLGIVASAAQRSVDRKGGVIFDATGGWVSEAQRRAAATLRANDCELGNDYLLMQAFDALIGNAKRSTDNLGYDRSLTRLRLRGFDDAFGTEALHVNPQAEPPKLPPALRGALVALDRSTLESSLDGTLSRREIDALLARRDTIVATWPTLD